jgi:hypothetical protein
MAVFDRILEKEKRGMSNKPKDKAATTQQRRNSTTSSSGSSEKGAFFSFFLSFFSFSHPVVFPFLFQPNNRPQTNSSKKMFVFFLVLFFTSFLPSLFLLFFSFSSCLVY